MISGNPRALHSEYCDPSYFRHNKHQYTLSKLLSGLLLAEQ